MERSLRRQASEIACDNPNSEGSDAHRSVLGLGAEKEPGSQDHRNTERFAMEAETHGYHSPE